MIVPEYWAEANKKISVNGRPITIKRFGWSDISAGDAETNAKIRLDEAISNFELGKETRKIDHRVAYNGAEGLPIREEIISRHNDAVITRNSYGALCINTPDVLFADIDFSNHPGFKFYIITFLVLMLGATFASFYFNSEKVFAALLFVNLIFTSLVANGVFRIIIALKGGKDNIAMAPVKKFSNRNPDWHLRIYRTPAGYRVLVMHKTFNARDEETLKFLREIGSDPVYIQMCKNQNCFRARVSPKPWRVGINRMPKSGVWPVSKERLIERSKWVGLYETKIHDYASCKFLAKLGSNNTHEKANYIRELHDEYCNSDKGYKLA